MPPESGAPEPKMSVQEIIDGFRLLASFNAGANDPESATQLSFTVATLEHSLIGEPITASELPIAREIGHRAITRWGRKNEHQITRGIPGLATEYVAVRTHSKTDTRYIGSDIFRYLHRSSGIIEAVDARYGSLIVRPNIGQLWWDRHWVQILDENGQQLVDLEY